MIPKYGNREGCLGPAARLLLLVGTPASSTPVGGNGDAQADDTHGAGRGGGAAPLERGRYDLQGPVRAARAPAHDHPRQKVGAAHRGALLSLSAVCISWTPTTTNSPRPPLPQPVSGAPAAHAGGLALCPGDPHREYYPDGQVEATLLPADSHADARHDAWRWVPSTWWWLRGEGAGGTCTRTPARDQCVHPLNSPLCPPQAASRAAR